MGRHEIAEHLLFSDPFTGMHPFNTVPATTYNGFVNGYDGIPFTNYDGVPVTTYNGAPDASYHGATFNSYHGVRGLPVGHTPGFGSGRVYGYSFGPLPYAYSVFGDLPFAGFHDNVDIDDSDLIV